MEVGKKLGIDSPKKLFLPALPFAALTIALGISAYFLLPGVRLETDILRIIFIGLAAFSVPHMLAIDLPSKKALAHPKPGVP